MVNFDDVTIDNDLIRIGTRNGFYADTVYGGILKAGFSAATFPPSGPSLVIKKISQSDQDPIVEVTTGDDTIYSINADQTMSLKPVSGIPEPPTCTEVGRILLNTSGDLCSCKFQTGTTFIWKKVSDDTNCF